MIGVNALFLNINHWLRFGKNNNSFNVNMMTLDTNCGVSRAWKKFSRHHFINNKISVIIFYYLSRTFFNNILFIVVIQQSLHSCIIHKYKLLFHSCRHKYLSYILRCYEMLTKNNNIKNLSFLFIKSDKMYMIM